MDFTVTDINLGGTDVNLGITDLKLGGTELNLGGTDSNLGAELRWKYAEIWLFLASYRYLLLSTCILVDTQADCS